MIKGFLDVMTKYMEEKLTKKEAIEQTQKIQYVYAPELDEKSAFEEWLGKGLTDEEYEALKKSDESKKFKEHYES